MDSASLLTVWGMQDRLACCLYVLQRLSIHFSHIFRPWMQKISRDGPILIYQRSQSVNMMFHYKQYRSSNIELITAFIRRFPLALITSFVAGQWQSSHVPLFWSNDKQNELF